MVESEMKVLGKKEVNFKDDEGKTVTGLSLFVSFKEEGVEGLAATKYFFSDQHDAFLVASALKIGDTVKPVFNRFGKIAELFQSK